MKCYLAYLEINVVFIIDLTQKSEIEDFHEHCLRMRQELSTE